MNREVKLYNEVSNYCSELITKKYSTSFSLGINTLHKSIHKYIYNIYGFVRFADEIVDTFHDLDKKRVLDEFEKETLQSIKNKFSTNPVLHSFQMVVNKFNIDDKHIKAFLDSMRMDLTMKKFSDQDLKDYLKKISDEALYAYNVYQIEGEGRKLFTKIDGDENTVMGLPVKKIKDYLESYKWKSF